MQNFFQKLAHNSMFDRNITAIGIIAAVAGRNEVFSLKKLIRTPATGKYFQPQTAECKP